MFRLFLFAFLIIPFSSTAQSLNDAVFSELQSVVTPASYLFKVIGVTFIFIFIFWLFKHVENPEKNGLSKVLVLGVMGGVVLVSSFAMSSVKDGPKKNASSATATRYNDAETKYIPKNIPNRLNAPIDPGVPLFQPQSKNIWSSEESL